MATRWIQSPFPHFPVDDLESFYYTTQWATAFNDGPSEREQDRDKIREFREMISSDQRTYTMGIIKDPDDLWESDKQEYGAFFAHSMVPQAGDPNL